MMLQVVLGWMSSRHVDCSLCPVAASYKTIESCFCNGVQIAFATVTPTANRLRVRKRFLLPHRGSWTHSDAIPRTCKVYTQCIPVVGALVMWDAVDDRRHVIPKRMPVGTIHLQAYAS